MTLVVIIGGKSTFAIFFSCQATYADVLQSFYLKFQLYVDGFSDGGNVSLLPRLPHTAPNEHPLPSLSGRHLRDDTGVISKLHQF